MNVEKPDNSKQKMAAGLVTLVVIALLAGGAAMYSSTSQSNTSNQNLPATSSSSAQPNSVPSPSASSSSFKDGTYSATSDYYVPHGSESIKVTVTVTNGTVTDSSIENSEYNRESARFQQEFAAEYKSAVVGKPISSLQLDYVAGASDTTKGFNNALQKIKSEAQA